MGKQHIWTIEKMKAGFDRFYQEHGHYPVATEIDQVAYLPSSRQMQRRFPGGLPGMRKLLKIGGQSDYSMGEHSSQRALAINKRAHALEQKVYEYLSNRFGAVFVHREYLFTDDHRNRADFYVYTKEGAFCVDVFYPKDKTNFLGCLNSKMKTYSGYIYNGVPIIFLMMNDAIAGETIEAIVQAKKNKLPKHQQVMTLDQFKQYCESRHKMSVAAD